MHKIRFSLFAFFLFAFALQPGAAPAAERFCSDTAQALRDACGAEVEDDFHVARAQCINVSDDDEREECFGEANQERRHGHRFCGQLLRGRRNACNLLGQERYDPDFDPEDFDDDYHNPVHPNAYFPLLVGNRWEFAGGTETNIVEVLDETKLIEGLTCIVVRDRVFFGSDLHENTDDWYCQALNGDVYYLGEEVKDYESYDGDDPRVAELVSMDGSFKHGRDGDKGGLIFSASPAVGDAYIEEFSLGNAEDVTEILSTTYSYGARPELDNLVPAALANYLCAGNCVVTKNYSLLEPGIYALKYYTPGIGIFLEVEPDVSLAIRLTDCNFDSRCDSLPQP